MAARASMLIDVTKCMGCRACQVACKQWNQLPADKSKFTGTYENPPRLSAKTWTLVQFVEPPDFDRDPRWLFRKRSCLHCGEASCMQACPTGAIRRQPNGVVYIEQSVCAGCKYCGEVCPFQIPHYDSDSGTARKCWMCLDRLADGLEPACATACPTGAVAYGDRDELMEVGQQRLQALRPQHPGARLYGATELGGLGVMYLLPEEASAFGLPENPRVPHAGILYRWLLGIIPGLAILGWLGARFAKDEPAEVAEPTEAAGGGS